MNIAIMVSSLSLGGAEKQAITDANMLSRESATWLISFSEGPQKGLIDSGVHYLRIPKRGYVRTAVYLSRAIRENDIRVLHVSLFASSIIGALASLVTGVRVIWHFHSHEYDAPPLSRLAFTVASRLPGVKRIIFVSNELRDDLRERFHLPNSKLEVIYNSSGVGRAGVRTGHSLKITVGYVGRLVKLKRVSYLLDLAEYLRGNEAGDFSITIVGDGDQKSKLEEECAARDLMNVVEFVGFQQDTASYYSRFDIFVNPSEEECLSIALIDAGVTGLPAVAFDVGGNREIIEDGSSGFIVHTEEEFFRQVHLLMSDEELRRKMAERAAVICAERFNRKVRERKLIEVSESVG